MNEEQQKANLELTNKLILLTDQYSQMLKTMNELFEMAKPVLKTQIQKFVEEHKTFEQ